MSEGRTRNLPNGRSFEEHVLARFDATDAQFDRMDARFDRMDARFGTVEARFDSLDVRLDGVDTRVQALEARALDTKPIWERALAGILELKEGIEDIKRKIDVLSLDVIKVRADQRGAETRIETLESRLQ